MASIDIDRLNHAAKTLHDAAFSQGERAGREASSHETVEHVGRGILGLTAQVLRLAAELPEAEQRMKAARLARSFYGRTPGGGSFDGGRLPGRFDRILGRPTATDIDIEAARETAIVLDLIAAGGESR